MRSHTASVRSIERRRTTAARFFVMSDIAVQEDAAVAASARPASRANPGGTARDAQTI
ncbi:LuxR family transcriptional regulator, partial [Burkholderia mallei]|nr:LuxR family transcriptional regulator [Burkholderia mallei]